MPAFYGAAPIVLATPPHCADIPHAQALTQMAIAGGLRGSSLGMGAVPSLLPPASST